MIGIMSWPRQTQHLKYVYRYVVGCDSWQQADNSNILLIINDGEWAVYGQRGPVHGAQPGQRGGNMCKYWSRWSIHWDWAWNMHHMSRFRSSEYYAEAARTSKLSKYCMKGRDQDRVHILYPGVGISYLAAANMLGMNGPHSAGSEGR